MLAIMEVLESRTSRDVTLRLLQIVLTVSVLVKYHDYAHCLAARHFRHGLS